jgi:L-ribulose-5-phosphate 3-epimerase
MNRRELLKFGTATIAAAALTGRSVGQATVAPQTPAARPVPTGKFPLDVYSRDLQWLRTPQDVAKAVVDIGLRSVDLTVMPYPGHVDPQKVETDLPPFVAGLKTAGVAVSAITCPITDADSPNAEAILRAASSAGIHYYSWGGFQYDESKPYPPQLDLLKPRVAKLAKLNQKYGIKALYQSGADSKDIGAAFFDFLEVLRNFDPRYVSFRYDTGMVQGNPKTIATQLRLGAAYIGGMALNDAVAKLELPVWHDGQFVGDPKSAAGQGAGGDNTGRSGGNPLAIGGGGRPLPYHFELAPVGTGMVDFALVGTVLKEINFSGPAECQSDWPLGGAEEGNDKITTTRLEVLGQLKHNRLMIEQAFATSWNIDVARPPFMTPGGAAAAPGRGEGRGPGPYWPE